MFSSRKFLEVDTNGMCLLCKNPAHSDPNWTESEPTSVSLWKFLRYLEVDTSQLVNASLQVLDNMCKGENEDIPVNTNENVEVCVTLCDPCSMVIEQFDELYLYNNGITNPRIDKCVRSLHQFMKNADESATRVMKYRKRMQLKQVPESVRAMFNASFTGILRNEIFYKCIVQMQGTHRSMFRNLVNCKQTSEASTSSARPRNNMPSDSIVNMSSTSSEPRHNFGGSGTNASSTLRHSRVNNSCPKTRANGGEDQSKLRMTVSPLSAVSTKAVLASITSFPGSIDHSANVNLGDETPPPQLERMDSPWSYATSRASTYSAGLPSTSGASVRSSYASASCLSNRDQYQKADKNGTIRKVASKVNPRTSRASQPLQWNSAVVSSADSATAFGASSRNSAILRGASASDGKKEAWDIPSNDNSRGDDRAKSLDFRPNRSTRQQLCPDCHTMFSPSQKQEHLAVHHPEVIVQLFVPPAYQFQCTYAMCMKAFDHVLPYDHDTQNHCPYCDLVCSTRNQLKFHLLSDHVEKFAEEVCSHAGRHPVPQRGEEERGDAEGGSRRRAKRPRDDTPVAGNSAEGGVVAEIDDEVVDIMSIDDNSSGAASDYQLCHVCQIYKRRKYFRHHLNFYHPESLVGKCFPPGKESECTNNMCTTMFEALLSSREKGSKDRFQCPYCTCTLSSKKSWKYHVVSTHAQILANEMSAAFQGSVPPEGESGNGGGTGNGARYKRAQAQCDVCGDCFGSRVKLTQHKKSWNEVESCFLCGFTAPGCSLTVHQRSAHTVAMVMKEIPGKSKLELTPLVDKILGEIATDDNKCGRCGQILESLEALKGHFFATHFRELVKQIRVRCGSRGNEDEARDDE